MIRLERLVRNPSVGKSFRIRDQEMALSTGSQEIGKEVLRVWICTCLKHNTVPVGLDEKSLESVGDSEKPVCGNLGCTKFMTMECKIIDGPGIP
jgi:hypothetical protein